MNLFRRKTSTKPASMDTRRVNLSEVGQSSDTLSSRIDWPDLLRPLDQVFAGAPVGDDPVVAETLALVDSAAPHVDEFTADALNGWLDEHLPGWAAHTDYEMRRRIDVQRTLIAEITQNYAVVAARVGHQRQVVAELEAVVQAADRVLAGLSDTLADPAPDQTTRTAVTPLRLPDLTGFGHPDLSGPPPAPTTPSPTGPQQISIVPEPATDTKGEVA